MPSAPVTGRERRSPTPAALRKRDAIRRLKQAQADDRLELQYQPIVRAGEGGTVGLEALLKWRAAEAEEDSLTDLIWVAERSPVIFQLENWILERALREARALPAALRVNVNLSAREFSRADLMRRLSRRLRAAQLEPSRIGIEITETSAMHDLEAVAGQLQGLREKGIELWLDDFGTGHSSLEWLSHFPLDGLKIAGTFVGRLPADRRCRVIAERLIGLAHELGLRVVAEGVEKEEQRDFLVGRQCDLLQGFLLSPPLHPSQVAAAAEEEVG